MWLEVALLAGLLFVQVGCAGPYVLGRPINVDLVKDIQAGRSDVAWVEKKFGRPQEKFKEGELTIYAYRYILENGAFQELVITFREGLVTHHSYHRHEEED